MREVCVVIATVLALSHWLCRVDGQSKKYACSYGYEEANRLGYLPDYIPMEICTHVVFKWFNFPRFVGRQMHFDDNDKLAFSRLVTSVRKRTSTGRVVASITGTGSEYSTMSGTNVRRRAFVQAVSSLLLLELDADGIELAWDSPGNENSGTGIATDRLTMVTLLQDLRQAMSAASKLINGRNRELWMRGSLHPNLISTSYNTFDVCDLVDHVTLLSTNNGLAASHAPMNSRKLTPPQFGNFKLPEVIDLGDGIIDATQTWIDNGCPPKKLLLGIGLHGVFKTVNTYQQQFLGDFIGSPGPNDIITYRDVCQTLRQQGWSVAWDPTGLTPYATRALSNGQTQRISYEDLNSVRYKMDLVEQKRLGGVYTNYIHSDDIYGSCGQAYPLSAYIASRLRAIPSDIGFAIEWS